MYGRGLGNLKTIGFYIKSEAMWFVSKESIHARHVLYSSENAVYFQLPVSFVMAVSVAMQGK